LWWWCHRPLLQTLDTDLCWLCVFAIQQHYSLRPLAGTAAKCQSGYEGLDVAHTHNRPLDRHALAYRYAPYTITKDHKGSRDYTTFSIVEYMKLDNEKRLVDANNNYVQCM
jgi:hypothetical protein